MSGYSIPEKITISDELAIACLAGLMASYAHGEPTMEFIHQLMDRMEYPADKRKRLLDRCEKNREMFL